MSGKWPPILTADALEHLSDEEFWGYVHECASFTPPAPSPEEYLKCELSSGDCLISLTALYEVMPCPQHFALLPATPAWMVGIFAWRGETIAVIDLDAYLSTPASETDPTLAHDPEAGYNHVPDKSALYCGRPGQLLIANCSDLPVGLLVATRGVTTTQSEASVLDIPAILMDIVQRIGEGTHLA